MEKIKLIKKWFHAEEDFSFLPKHIRIIIGYIESMDLFKELAEMKKKDETDIEVVGRKYFRFLEDYFSEQRRYELLILLKEGFEKTFQNLT